MYNRVILMGRLTRDPEIRQTQSGVSVCKFSIACNRPFANKETGEREADFIDCDAWRQTADFIGRYFSQGSMILVEGQLRNNNYTDSNGTKHYGMRVLVDAVSFCGDSKQQQGGAQNQAPAQRQQPRQARQAQAAAPAQAQFPDLSEFETILSDGDVPF